jgi:cytochrome c oxidase subunit 2
MRFATLCFGIFALFTPAMSMADATGGNAAAGKAAYASCQVCHGLNAEGNQALNAPALARQSDWYLQRQLMNFRKGIRGSHPQDTYGAQMQPMAVSLASDQAVIDVVAYIKTLKKIPTPITLKGDNKNGKDYYNMVCGACHGPAAEGNVLLNSPRLAGIDDWYLVRQFMNFKQGIRGRHADDKYGKQMAAMTKALPGEKEVRDVVSYIRSLEN